LRGVDGLPFDDPALLPETGKSPITSELAGVELPPADAPAPFIPPAPSPAAPTSRVPTPPAELPAALTTSLGHGAMSH
jgi:hypothetical protein